MKRKRNRYKRSKWIQYMLNVLIVALCVLVIFKGIYIVRKVNLVNESMKLYDQKEWIEAEHTLQRAKDYNWFRYKEKHLGEMVKKLEWITQYHTTFEEMYKSIQDAEAHKDYSTFTQNRENYESLGFHQLEPWQKEYLLGKYPIEVAIDSSWLTFKVYMQGILSTPNEKSAYNWAKEKVFEIPDAYFTGDKLAAIEGLFITCDTRLYEYYINHSNGLDTMLQALNEIYETNSKVGYDTYWLTDQIKAYVKEKISQNTAPLDEDTLRQIRNNPKNSQEENTMSLIVTQTNTQITNLIKDIKAYRNYVGPSYYDEDIEEMVRQYLETKESEIRVLVEAKYFDEAISWYEHLSGLKGYGEEIKRLKDMKIFEYPELILGAQLNDYPIYLDGEDALGADKYLVTLNTVTSKFEVHRLVGTAEEYTKVSIQRSLDELGLKGMDYSALKKVHISGELIRVYVPDSENQTVQVIKVEGEEMIPIFRTSGEEITGSSDLRTLTVKNPKDEEIPNTYTYQYDGESYIKQEIDRVEAEIDAPELPQKVEEVTRYFIED